MLLNNIDSGTNSGTWRLTEFTKIRDLVKQKKSLANSLEASNLDNGLTKVKDSQNYLAPYKQDAKEILNTPDRQNNNQENQLKNIITPQKKPASSFKLDNFQSLAPVRCRSIQELESQWNTMKKHYPSSRGNSSSPFDTSLKNFNSINRSELKSLQEIRQEQKQINQSKDSQSQNLRTEKFSDFGISSSKPLPESKNNNQIKKKFPKELLLNDFEKNTKSDLIPLNSHIQMKVLEKHIDGTLSPRHSNDKNTPYLFGNISPSNTTSSEAKITKGRPILTASKSNSSIKIERENVRCEANPLKKRKRVSPKNNSEIPQGNSRTSLDVKRDHGISLSMTNVSKSNNLASKNLLDYKQKDICKQIDNSLFENSTDSFLKGQCVRASLVRMEDVSEKSNKRTQSLNHKLKKSAESVSDLIFLSSRSVMSECRTPSPNPSKIGLLTKLDIIKEARKKSKNKEKLKKEDPASDLQGLKAEKREKETDHVSSNKYGEIKILKIMEKNKKIEDKSVSQNKVFSNLRQKIEEKVIHNEQENRNFSKQKDNKKPRETKHNQLTIKIVKPDENVCKKIPTTNLEKNNSNAIPPRIMKNIDFGSKDQLKVSFNIILSPKESNKTENSTNKVPQSGKKGK